MIAQTFDATAIRADQLTEGDIIQHSTTELWMVVTEPKYTTNGISFDVLCLDVEGPNNTQTVCFAPEASFILLDHQPGKRCFVTQGSERHCYEAAEVIAS